MLERTAPSATACRAVLNSPQREGRPCHRHRRRDLRPHPYLRHAHRTTSSSLEPLRAASINGNGQVSTLTKGLDGAELSVAGDQLPEIHQLLQRVAAGELDPALAATHITSASQQVSDDSPARDVWGEGGMPAEIVWSPGRSATQIAISLQRAAQDCGRAMAARVTEQVAAEVAEILPEAKYHPSASAMVVTSPDSSKQKRLPGTVAILGVVAGEEAIAEEARLACSVLGCYSYKLVGTAANGSVPNLAAAQSAAVVVVLAKEGDELLSVVAGLTNAPVVAIPAGSSSELQAPGVSVVGNRNGVAAAIVSARILQLAARIGGAGK